MRTGHGNRWTRERVTGVRSSYHIPVYRESADGTEPWLNLSQAAAISGVAPRTLRLVVSARLRGEAPGGAGAPTMADGIVTRLGTFQRFYEQQELRAWIDETLGEACVAAAPGVFYVFRHLAERSSFAASRFRRATAAPRLGSAQGLYAEHRGIMEALALFLSARGRLPSADELPEHDAIVGAMGSVGRAFCVLRAASPEGLWEASCEARSQDLLVYLALSRFDRRPPFGGLPPSLQLDVRAFFRTYAAACARADGLLFSLGDPARLDAACRTSPFGKLMPEALYVQRRCSGGAADCQSAAEWDPRSAPNPFGCRSPQKRGPYSTPINMPTPLRLYEGCARACLGSVAGATLVKLRRGEPNVSYLTYPGFEADPHPALAASVNV